MATETNPAALRTVQILACGRWDHTITIQVPVEAETAPEDARSVLLGLDSEITHYRGLACEHDDTCVWGCEVKVGGEWYESTMEDHYHESAEIQW